MNGMQIRSRLRRPIILNRRRSALVVADVSYSNPGLQELIRAAA
jgi:hypothetical protein